MDLDSLPPGFGGPSQAPLQQTTVDRSLRPKDKKVTWALGEKLCQIRLFVAEDAPSMAGATRQESLQAKKSRLMYPVNSSYAGSDLPPGFGVVAPKPSRPDPTVLASIVPQITWRRPDAVSLDPGWLITPGGISREVDLQKQREVRVLEAVYPRPSAIPESPAEPLEPQDPYDDSQTPQIPLVPLDDDDIQDGMDSFSNSGGARFQPLISRRQGTSLHAPMFKPVSLPNGFHEPGNHHLPATTVLGPDSMHLKNNAAWTNTTPAFVGNSEKSMGRTSSTPDLSSVPSGNNGAEPDVAAAAAAAFAALSKSKEMGSMIDNNLLIQILSNPNLIQTLTGTQPFPLSLSSKSDIPSNGELPSVLERATQALSSNIVSRSGVGNQWASLSATALLAAGQEVGKLINGDGYQNGVDRLVRNSVTDERSQSFLPSSLGTSQAYMEQINGRLDASTNSISSNGSTLPFTSNSSTLQTQHALSSVGAVSSRPLSRHDEQYFKSLILQHGKSADDDHARAGVDTRSNSSARVPVNFGRLDGSRWYGREEGEGMRLDRSRRDNDGSSMGAALDFVNRTKPRKACIYFATPRGCRNGASCTFLHELSESDQSRAERERPDQPQLQSVKRLKVDG